MSQGTTEPAEHDGKGCFYMSPSASNLRSRKSEDDENHLEEKPHVKRNFFFLFSLYDCVLDMYL